MKTRLILAVLGILLAARVNGPGEITLGSTKEEVLQELGKPEAEIMRKGLESLVYGGSEIQLKFGRVVRMDADVVDRAHQTRAVKAAAPVQVAQAPTPPVTAPPAAIATPSPGPALASPNSARVQVIRGGGAVISLSELVVPGKVTLVDFFADWCGPCRAISPYLEKVANDDPDVYLRKVDIVKWDTPVAAQYHLHSIPSIRVFNRRGEMVGQPTFDFDRVREYIGQAK